MNETNEKRTPGKGLRLGTLILAVVLVFHVVSPAAGAIGQKTEEPVPEVVTPMPAADYLQLAEAAIAQEAYETAMHYLEAAKGVADPLLDAAVLADVLVKIVSIQILQADYATAIDTIEEYRNDSEILLDNTLAGILAFLKAGCLVQTGALEQAIQAFQEAENLGYDKVRCLEQRVTCSFELGDYKAVAAAGGELLAIQNAQLADSPLFYEQLGISYVYLENYVDALECLMQANKAQGNPRGNGYYRGICLISLEQPAEAAEAFTDAIEEGSLVSYSHYNRGVCYLDLMDYEKAWADMEKTVEMGEDPSLVEAAQTVLDQLKKLDN